MLRNNEKHQSVVIVAVVVAGDEAAESLTTPSLASAPDMTFGLDVIVFGEVLAPIGSSMVCPTTHPIRPSADSVIVTLKSSTGRVVVVLSTIGPDFESQELEVMGDVSVAAESTVKADMTAVWAINNGLSAIDVRMGSEATVATDARPSCWSMT